MTPLIYPLPSPADKSIARQHAVEIARLLGSKVLCHRRIIVGEPQCPFRVPCHQDDFWFTVFVSDAAYRFTGEHRRHRAFRASFELALEHPYTNLAATERVPSLSAGLGLDVFQSRLPSHDNSADVVLTTPIRDLIRQIDFSTIRTCYLNSTQIYVIAQLRDPDHCVQQVRIFRQLLLTVFHAVYPTPGNA